MLGRNLDDDILIYAFMPDVSLGHVKRVGNVFRQILAVKIRPRFTPRNFNFLYVVIIKIERIGHFRIPFASFHAQFVTRRIALVKPQKPS